MLIYTNYSTEPANLQIIKQSLNIVLQRERPEIRLKKGLGGLPWWLSG